MDVKAYIKLEKNQENAVDEFLYLTQEIKSPFERSSIWFFFFFLSSICFCICKGNDTVLFNRAEGQSSCFLIKVNTSMERNIYSVCWIIKR